MGKGVTSKSNEHAKLFTKELFGMGLLLFSLLSFLCLITGDAIFYKVGAYVQGFFLGLFGYFSFPVLAIIVIFGLRLLLSRAILTKPVRFYATVLCIFAFAVMAIVQTAVYYDKGLTFAENFISAYGNGQFNFATCTCIGGFSYLIISPVGAILSKVGCYILFSLVIVGMVLLLFRDKMADFTATKRTTNKKQNKRKTNQVEDPSNKVEPSFEDGVANQVYKPTRPQYMAEGDFKVKSKRDYNRDSQINVFGGDFAMQNKKRYSSDYNNMSYSDGYKRGLGYDPDAILKPMPIRPENIGQPPIKATNPSRTISRDKRDADVYDRSSLGGSVYTSYDNEGSEFSRKPFNNLNNNEADYSPEKRGGLFDNYDGKKSAYNTDIRGRLGVDRGKQSTQDQLDKTVQSFTREDLSQKREYNEEERSNPNIEKTYNPLIHNRADSNGFNADIVAKTRGEAGKGRTTYGGQPLNEALLNNNKGATDDFNNTKPSDLDGAGRVVKSASERLYAEENLGPFGGYKEGNTQNPTVAEKTPRRTEEGGIYLEEQPTFNDGRTGVHHNYPEERASRTIIEQSPSPIKQNTVNVDIDEEDDQYQSIDDMPLNYRYRKPSVDLLANREIDKELVLRERARLKELAHTVEENFALRGVNITLENIVYGMSVTRFEYSIPTVVSVNKITSAQGDLAVWLHSSGDIRIIAPIPGTSRIGIEVPNEVRSTVGLKELLRSKQFTNLPKSDKGIYIALGKNIMAEPVFVELTAMPHLLIAGATGTGKSVFLNTMLVSMLYTYSPEDLRIVIVDPKKLEFVDFEGIPHLLFNKIITKPNEAAALLTYIEKEMDNRYELFAKARVKKISDYNAKIDTKTEHKLPYIIVLIDEFADLMMQSATVKKSIEDSITRLAQLARAAGISLVFATQRPTTDVIDGTIKTNFPARICFKTADYTNSQVVLGENGAEKLLGNGDLLCKGKGPTERAQGAYVDADEIKEIVEYVKDNNKCYYDKNALSAIKDTAKNIGAEPSSDNSQMSMDIGSADSSPDQMPNIYKQAVRLVIVLNNTSKSILQTKLGIGYNKAARIIDWMEKEGFISYAMDNKQREIKIDRASYEQIFKEPFDEDFRK